MPATSANVFISQNSAQPAAFSTTWLSPSVAVISVYGELDAANAPEFTDYLDRHTTRADRLVVDLSGVQFFGAAVLSTLQDLDRGCLDKGTAWGLTTCPTLNRLVQICEVELPVYPSVTAALNGIRRQSVQLVT